MARLSDAELEAMAERVYERSRREQGLPPHIPADSATADRLVDLLGLLDDPAPEAQAS